MRSTGDRIRHAISFELGGLALISPLGAWAFGMPVADVGVVGVACAIIATVWTYIYNLAFDAALQRLRGGTHKSLPLRILHAVVFELALLALLMPVIAWYLEVGLVHALVMDVAFAGAYMVYALVFNWAYDRAFPLPEWQGETQPHQAAL
ncbi:PACE efflux transporter [Microvirga arabica]|uniref:PACE efflux transporter n=1 Tax=Microvirga arabica TaxID=1128671 RepID=A0ABV6Y5A9_9HYPH|nr:PACE efflux transporter [Microvirga arabica]MBM1172244.1 PACE efflux transporter [Microvirga arabica]